METGVETNRSVFWDDLARDLEDPQFLREYIVESVRIATIDRLVNALDEARESAGMSKAALARAISSEPAVVRRLFSAGHVNPTVGTMAEVAAALGMRLTLEPLPESERAQVCASLVDGRTLDPRALIDQLEDMRTHGRKPAQV
jgi:DNA-binding phage protein